MKEIKYHNFGQPPATPESIAAVERYLGVSLPSDYKEFLMRHDGCGLDPDNQYFPLPSDRRYSIHVTDLWSSHSIHAHTYTILHNHSLHEKHLPDWLLPIGNCAPLILCLAIRGRDRGAVFIASLRQTPYEHEKIADTFEQFVDGLKSRFECAHPNHPDIQPSEKQKKPRWKFW